MSVEIGSQIGRYRLERRLGSGGMGEVFLAQDTQLHRQVAIKFLTGLNDLQARRRLLREARASAALDHPNICAVFEVGNDPAGGDFIAMQYIDGETLAARLRRGRLRPDEALNLGAQMAEALQAAHRRGLVHRDLKPQNIIITPTGSAKLLDFGVATYAPRTAGAANAATTSGVSAPGSVVGTPAYMSPEQVRDEPADVRADVFALGAVLYECLTGARAFQGATTAEILGNVLHVDPPAVSMKVPELGVAYDALCARLLDKIPEERFQSAEEVLGAIRALTPSTRLSAPLRTVAVRRTSYRISRRVIVALVAVALVAGAYAWWPRPIALPTPTAAAATWYDAGVEAMRDGTYAAARAAFTDAIKAFADYPQAYWRLAEADIALEDEKGASDALVAASRLVPDRSRLRAEDALRYNAASAAAIRQREDAVKVYQQLADRKADDAGRWIDLGRAQEVAGHVPEAIAAYEKAIAVDSLSAAAHLRLGVLQFRTSKPSDGRASIDRALNQYRKLGRTEGEAEALVRKAVALAPSANGDEVRALFNQVIQLAGDGRYQAQRVAAQFGLAKLDYRAGHATDAAQLATRAVDAAVRAGLPTLAAVGLVDLAGVLIGGSFHEEADARLDEAIRLASEHGASRTENRAKLTKASNHIQTNDFQAALDLAAGPAAYFKTAGEAGLLSDADLILSRGYAGLDQFDRANELAAAALGVAQAAGNNTRIGYALDIQASQLQKQGQLPESAAAQQLLLDLHRRVKEEASVPRDLTNLAELMLWLGQFGNADGLLRDVEQRIAKDDEPSRDRRERVAQLRLLAAALQCRWAEVDRLAANVRAEAPPRGSGQKLNSAQGWARIFVEYARAEQNRSREDPAAVSQWPNDADNAADRRDWSAPVAWILLRRGEFGLARQVVQTTLSDPIARTNLELAWRLTAIGAEAARHGTGTPPAAGAPSDARAILTQMQQAWGDAAVDYLRRPDLAVLLKTIR